jgi:hypothetical protein
MGIFEDNLFRQQMNDGFAAVNSKLDRLIGMAEGNPAPAPVAVLNGPAAETLQTAPLPSDPAPAPADASAVLADAVNSAAAPVSEPVSEASTESAPAPAETPSETAGNTQSVGTSTVETP